MRNPLLGPLDTGIPFDEVRGEHVEPGIDALLAAAEERLQKIERDASPRTYENTLDALEAVTDDLGRAMGVVAHLESVATTPALRAAYNAVQPRVSAFYSRITLSEPLWNALKSYGAIASLDGAKQRFLEKTLDDFKRSGADLDPQGKERLAAIDVELTTLAAKYAQNVLDATNAFELVVHDESKLAGLPDSARAAARESAKKKGLEGWRFTLQSPSYAPLMTYLDDRGLREKVYRAFHTRATSGPFDNRAILLKLIALRREKARLLGYATFGDLVLADRMAKDSRTALAFVDDLRKKARPAFERENEELEKFAGVKLEPWDLLYHAEKMRRALYDLDEEALRPYYPAPKVLLGLFDVAERLYGVKVSTWEGARKWDDAVTAHVMRDRSGKEIARFYLDLYPRETKQDGAWMHGMVNGVLGKAHLAVIVANVTPPVGDRPALLARREVETLFHEFGHLLHHCLSEVEVKSLAGTQVATDFVELPSKIMENWCWEKEALDMFARHFQTDAAIPGALFDKMMAAKCFRAANMLMRQLGFAAVDLALHTDYSEEKDGDVMDYARKILDAHSPVRLPPEHAMIAAFTHLFADPVGYAAGYYSYQWSEVLDADAFTRFREKGLFDREVGEAFRARILSRGNSEDPMALYKSFMGREPRVDALLERAGLSA